MRDGISLYRKTTENPTAVPTGKVAAQKKGFVASHNNI
jgi:hypothetical protein